MYSLEFNEVMALVGQEVLNKKNLVGEEKEFWEKVNMAFGPTYYTIASGRIPLEFAKFIYEKYPSNPYGIRVHGGESDWNPRDWAVADKLIALKKQNYDLNDVKREFRNFRRRLDKNKFIEYYHIDTKEGLVIFLTEMKDYLARKKGLPEVEVSKYDSYIEQINYELLKKINLKISSYDWMKADKENGKDFLENISKKSANLMQKELREAVQTFDDTFISFMDEEDGSLSEELCHSFYISGNVGEQRFRKNCCTCIIRDDFGNQLGYHRNFDGFSFQFQYTLGNKQVEVIHCFQANLGADISDGEEIVIHSNTKGEYEGSFAYNLSKNLVCLNYATPTYAEFKELSFVFNQLKEATEALLNLKKQSLGSVNLKREKLLENEKI